MKLAHTKQNTRTTLDLQICFEGMCLWWQFASSLTVRTPIMHEEILNAQRRKHFKR